ncbi:MAG TPA: bifunctional oligoribonuclease/PAP phosphatase NrnA [Candidatus Merdicola faecigallinarum]|uniref:Bifunctional oligoribonuclease/PAP phosphatase NrnA n=1 Tax=Candidatus Merdicola faecigallinarum TaxID=2840862 RepID=A0A9D1S9G0_9FIRM|nr:bifunctional oligoribonuclease/PAP phosphatase NrnA [Candidatus Merdicola faecigallinarum]
MTLDDITKAINEAETIAILTHESPDGDAMGSSLAMYNALKDMGKKPDIIIPEYPRTFSFLPGADEILKEGKQKQYDLVISLDCADLKRLNGFANYFEDAKTTISIDHHRMNPMFADYNYVDPASPACCQILVVILEYLKVEITKDIGTCLLTGIITDTGGFKYPGVTAETFEFAAWLLTSGVNVSNIYKKVLQIKTRANYELSKLAMNRMEFLEDDRITFTYITLEDEKRFQAEEGSHEGIVEIGRDIEGVEVSIFLHEAEDGFKVSLRSNEYINVSEVCFMFGGGGHMRAAGCKMTGTIEQIKNKLVNEIKKELK